MKQSDYYLKDDKKKGIPSNFIFFDVETIPEKINEEEERHNFRLGVCVYWERRKSRNKDTEIWLKFKKISEFWDFVENKAKEKRILYLVAHNINFDFRVLKGFEELKNRGWLLSKFFTTNNISIYSFRKEKKKIKVIDSMNYFNFSLRELGKTIGIEKMETPEYSENNEKWFIYCENDVKILLYAFKKLIEMIKNEEMGKFGLTLARQSLNLFLRKYYKTKIYIRRNEFIDEFERKAYYGGRVECFKIGVFNNDVYYNLDVNSLYPYVMKNSLLPYRLIGIYENVFLLDLENFLEKYNAIAKVRIKTDKPIYPYKHNNKLIFPIGNFETYLSTPELIEALKRGHIDKVDILFLYLRDNLFEDFVNDIYEKRKKAKENKDLTLSLFYKLFLNSLYGKFGQRNKVWEYVCIDENQDDSTWIVYDYDEKKIYSMRCINNIVEKVVGDIPAYFTYYPIPSHITSLGRVYLYSLIEKAGLENVFYVDTDSLFVGSKGFENLKDTIDDKELGKLSIRKIGNNLVLYGLKDYQFADEVKIKGIRKNAIKINDRLFIQTHFQTIKGALIEGRLNEVIVKYVQKNLYRKYDKGIILDDGRVIPFKINI